MVFSVINVSLGNVRRYDTHVAVLTLKIVFLEITNECTFGVFYRVAGGELQRVIDIHDGLEEVQAIHLLQQILKGLSFLHSYNIAHLDIKVYECFGFLIASRIFFFLNRFYYLFSCVLLFNS